jgi:hypothetical protein
VAGGTASYPIVSHARRAASNFTIISNGLGRDSRLSGNAVFVFLNICGHSEGYAISSARIRYQTGLGKDAVQAAFRLLKTLGYLAQERVRRDDGTFAYVYFTDDQPVGSPQNPTSTPLTDYPAPAVTSGGTQNPTSGPVPGYPAPAEPAPVDPATKKTRGEDQQTQDHQPPTPAPRSSARSAADVPKGPHLSDAREDGGSAAPHKGGDVEQVDPKAMRRARKALVTLLPPLLVAMLPRNIPRGLTASLAAQLADRTPDQMATRIQRRWDTHRYAAAAYAGTLERPIGVAYKLIAAGECPDPSCEDGAMIDTGLPCACCANRTVERRRSRTAADVAAANAALDAMEDARDAAAGAAAELGAAGPDWMAPAAGEDDQDERAAARRVLQEFIGHEQVA